MNSGFYYTKMKRNKSIKPLKKYLNTFPPYVAQILEKNPVGRGFCFGRSHIQSINKGSYGSKNPEIMEMLGFCFPSNNLGNLFVQNEAE